MSQKNLVVFTPSGRRGHFDSGTTVLAAAQELGVAIESICGGNARCGRCLIQVSEGLHAKFAINSNTGNLNKPTASEQKYSQKFTLPEGTRLSCQATINSDIVIDVPPASQTKKQVVRKTAVNDVVAVKAAVDLYYLTIADDSLDEQKSNVTRTAEALLAQHQMTIDYFDPVVLKQLTPAIDNGKGTVTVAVRHGPGATNNKTSLCACWPGKITTAYGFAIDIGTTSIAAHLCDLTTGMILTTTSQMNPQIKFGEDLMSRVSYVQMNSGSDVKLTHAVRQAINELMREAITEQKINSDHILEITIVGNPIMHHLFFGFDIVPLGQAPFTLTTNDSISIYARDLNLPTITLPVNSGAMIYALPCIAGHVGADTSAVILAERPDQKSLMSLLIDVGTNAEIVLGNRQKLFACSSPTGPAFEGGQISSGQRAAPGAIERVRIDTKTLKATFKVIGVDVWSDENGFDDLVSEIGINGICGSGIIEAIGEMYLAGIITSDGLIKENPDCPRVIADGKTFSYIIHDGQPQIKIIQNDVRAIQLAKAAAYAGIRLLMDHMQITKIDRIVLAGAFGSFIDPKYAMVLGLIPDCPLDQVVPGGNLAGVGARRALVNTDARQAVEDLVHKVMKIETALEPKFQEHFVAAMSLPHKTTPYPNLAQVVNLPAPDQTNSANANRGGRNRRRRKTS